MIDHVELDWNGETVTADCLSVGVTTAGVARATNARWHITRGEVTTDGLEGAPDDTEESVRAQIALWLLLREPDPVVPYKGYLIRPRPHQLPDTGEWAIDGQIWRQDGGGMAARPFSAKNRLPTREAAFRHTILLGQRFIDGEV